MADELSTQIYTAQQIQAIEANYRQRENVSVSDLMRRAGLATWRLLRDAWLDAKRIHVFCGTGNNGGDGYMLAALAKEEHYDVTVWQVGDHSQLSEASEQAKMVCITNGVSLLPFQENSSLTADVIVDALFGIGLNKPVTGDYATAINKINSVNIPIFSIDVPSGLEADTGNILGTAVKATITLTFIGLKLGLLTNHGRAYGGKLYFDHLMLSKESYQQTPPIATRLTPHIFSTHLPLRAPDTHKGDFGHVLVIGGDEGMPGAVRMAGESALRAGAGLVTIATRPQHINGIIASRPELMCHSIHDASELEPLLARATVAVIGPGLGRSDWSKELFACVMHSDLPIVIDGDALYWLAQFEVRKPRWILTPHPGEAARLLQTNTENIQQNRLAALGLLQMHYGGVIVLKGSGTLVLGESHRPAVCTSGNPGMASAGMGDILSGIIGALVAQSLPLEIAAHVGVLAHSRAADEAADKKGERGLLATDLLPYIRKLLNTPQ